MTLFDDPGVLFDDPGVLFDGGTAPSVPLMSVGPTIEELLDGTWPIRTESCRWDLLDRDRNLVGQLMVTTDRVPAITNDTQQSIRRSVSQIDVAARPLHDVDPMHIYADDLDTLTQMVSPKWILGDNEYPLGLFLFGDDSEQQWSWGSPRTVILADLCTDLDQPLDHAIGYSSNASVYGALVSLADSQGFTNSLRSIEYTTATLGQSIGWVPGRDTILSVFESLCKIAGFLPVYFDNLGILTCRSAVSLETAVGHYNYGDAAMPVTPGTIVSSSDLLTAPNRYVAIGATSIYGVPWVGIYDIPDAAPNSYANIRRYRRKTVDVQGASDQASVDAAAQAAYVSDSSTYSWLTFDSPIDPRQDTWDLVTLDGVSYRQLSTQIECRAGGVMHHECRGTYGEG